MTRILAGAVLVLCVGIWSGGPQVVRAQESTTEDDDAPAAPAEKADKPGSKSDSTAEKPDPAKDSGDKTDAKAADEKTPSEKATDEKSADDEEKPSSKATEKRDDARPGTAPGGGRGRRDFRAGPERGSSDAKSIIAEFSPAGTPAADGKEPRQKVLSFKFVKAPWTQVLEQFAKEANLTLDMEEPPTGTFTYTDNGRFTPTEALDIINGYLLKRGYLLIRRDQFLVVWNFDSPPPPNLVPMVKLADLDKRGRYEYVTVLIPVKHSVEAKTIADEISGSLLSPQGKIQTLIKSNQLKVTDIADNIREIARFVDDWDQTPPGKEMTFRDFELVHISASEAERQLRDLFGLPSRTNQAKGANEPTPSNRSQNNNGRGGGFDWRSMFGGGGGRGGFP
ncbi:MAG: hypothetical protein HY290_21695 [Planctomycetia bacterium]|nr:hypothetical protein [Planctomycetia bacterium]